MLAPALGARSYSRRVLRTAMLCLALGLPAAAAAQFPGHPLPPGARPFHERLAHTDLAAVVVVEQIEEGRLRVRREAALLGAPPERFEVKRSPLQPPPLATGDRALLLLRGARAPYVLADRPSEVIRLSDALSAVRWEQAVRAALEGRREPAALVPVYLDWIERGPETLRELGRASLEDLALQHEALHDEITRALAERR